VYCSLCGECDDQLDGREAHFSWWIADDDKTVVAVETVGRCCMRQWHEKMSPRGSRVGLHDLPVDWFDDRRDWLRELGCLFGDLVWSPQLAKRATLLVWCMIRGYSPLSLPDAPSRMDR